MALGGNRNKYFFYKYVVMLKKKIKFVNKSRRTFLYFFVVNPKIAFRYSVLKIYSICPVSVWRWILERTLTTRAHQGMSLFSPWFSDVGDTACACAWTLDLVDT